MPLANQSQPKPLAGKKILVVDDEELLRQILIEEFAYLGADICEASSGEEGSQIYDSSAPAVDLVITDLRMPRGGGLHLLQRIHQSRQPLPKIFVYSGQSEIAPEILAKFKISGFFTKPFRLDEIRDQICRALA